MRPPDTVPELPQLSAGIQLLEAPDRAIGPLHTLVLDTLIMDGGEAVWIDAHNHGTSIYLADVAPSPRILDRIHIARGFTPYQHQSLVQDTVSELADETSLIVAPALDGLYRGEDVRGNEPREMLLRSLSTLARYARDEAMPVLTTRIVDDRLSEPIERLATDIIGVKQTDFGPRFVGEEFETLLYSSNARTMQTTLHYWARILEARQPVYERTASQTATPIQN